MFNYTAILLILSFGFTASPALAEGTVESLMDYKYWDDGKTRGCDVYDANGHLRLKSYNRPDGTVEKIEKYDLSGNKTEEVLYDGKGKLMIGIDGWAAMRWWYRDSQLVSQMSYDENGKPISRKRYSEGGSLIEAQFADNENVNPYEEANMRLLLLGKKRNLGR